MVESSDSIAHRSIDEWESRLAQLKSKSNCLFKLNRYRFHVQELNLAFDNAKSKMKHSYAACLF